MHNFRGDILNYYLRQQKSMVLPLLRSIPRNVSLAYLAGW
jgi:hypothetical protein